MSALVIKEMKLSEFHIKWLNPFAGFLKRLNQILKKVHRTKGVNKRDVRHPASQLTIVLFSDGLNGRLDVLGWNDDDGGFVGFIAHRRQNTWRDNRIDLM